MAKSKDIIVESIDAFAAKFDQIPKTPDEDYVRFRFGLMVEELREIGVALERGDAVGAIDGMCDLTWVTIGTARGLGMNFQAHMDCVAEANMAKERGSKPGRVGGVSQYDVVKPDDWIPPEVKHRVVMAANPPAEVADTPTPGLLDLMA